MTRLDAMAIPVGASVEYRSICHKTYTYHIDKVLDRGNAIVLEPDAGQGLCGSRVATPSELVKNDREGAEYVWTLM